MFSDLITLSQRQEANTHDCPITYEGAIGGKFTYSFTPTSLGVIAVITCSCGYKLDCTDYELF